MAIYYFDSSALAKYYISERGSAWVKFVVEAASEERIVFKVITLSNIGMVEVAAAISRAKRMGMIEPDQQTALVVKLANDCKRTFKIVPITGEIVELATNLTQRHPLRGYDAVHLATALILNQALLRDKQPPLTFVSADEDLCKAARQEGLSVENPNEHEKVRGCHG